MRRWAIILGMVVLTGCGAGQPFETAWSVTARHRAECAAGNQVSCYDYAGTDRAREQAITGLAVGAATWNSVPAQNRVGVVVAP